MCHLFVKFQSLPKLGSSELNQPLATSGQETADVLLNGFKLGVATALALEMIEECGQSWEAASALSILVGAVVQRSLMNGAAKMLLQSSGAAEFAVADVALIARTIVSAIGVPGCVDGIAVVPFEEALCEFAIVVELA